MFQKKSTLWTFFAAPNSFPTSWTPRFASALAPKSNALYTGYGEVQQDLQKTASEPVPLHLRNAVTPLMKHQGYGSGYQYAHNVPEKVADMDCLPLSLAGRRYYQPTDEGLEKRLRARMEEIRGIKSRGTPSAAKP